MIRRTLLLALALLALALPAKALAGGGNYTVTGGTSAEQAQVHAALNASSFNWSLIPQTIQVQIKADTDSFSTPGVIVLDSGVLDSGRFGWATVQHEMGHQVDFSLLDDAKRTQLQQTLGGQDWCYQLASIAHSAHGCERFASMIAWAYWNAPDNALKPHSSSDEAGAMDPAAFRALLTQMIGASPISATPTALPTAAATPTAATTKAFAPKLTPAKTKTHA